MVFRPCYLTVILVCVVLLSCNQNKKEQEGSKLEVIQINEGDFEQSEVKLSDIVEDVELIPLETLEQSLMGGINKIVESPNGFLFLDNPGSSVIHYFSKDGKYIRQIGARGEAPDQYMSPQDFDLSGDFIFVLDQAGNLKIKKYSLETGQFLGVVSRKDAYGRQIVRLENGNWAIAGIHDQKKIEFFSTDSTLTHLIAEGIEATPQAAALPLNNAFVKSDNGIFLRFGSQDTIYKITKDGTAIKPGILISFEKRVTDEMYKEEIKKLGAAYVFKLPGSFENHMRYIFQFVDNDAIRYFNFFYKDKLHHVFINKKNGHKIIVPENKLNNDLFFQNKLLNISTSSIDKQAVMGLIFSNYIDEIKASMTKLDRKNQVNAKIAEALKNQTSESNPILVKYKFKNF